MEYTIRPFRPGEEEYVADAHCRVYGEEYRWNDIFSGYAVHIARDFAQKERSPREEMWIAEADGRPIGSIMLCETEDAETGQLRLFLVEKDCRRLGVGSALTGTLLARAREAGFRRLILQTASCLTDAIRIYGRLGFHKDEEIPNNDWTLDGSTVYEVMMSMELA